MPGEWTKVKLGMVADVIVGGTPSTAIPAFWGGDIHWMASGDVHAKRVFDVPGRITAKGYAASSAKLVSPPAVAIGLAGQGKTRGTAALVNIELSTNQSIALIKPLDEAADARYLFHDLDFRYDELRSSSAGGGRAGLSKGILQSLPLSLPPLPEQRRIADILDTLDRTIEGTQRIIAKLQAARQGLLHDLLTRGLDERGQLRDPEKNPEFFKDTVLGRVPRDWEVKRLWDVTDKIADRDHSTPQYVEHGILMISPTNFYGEEGINFQNAKQITLLAHKINSRKTDSRPGDILIHRIGAGLGRVREVSTNMPEFSILHSLALIRPNSDLITTSFLKWVLRGYEARMQLGLGIQSIGVPDLGLDKIGSVLIALPSKEEQVRLTNSLSAYTKKLSSEEGHLAKLQTLKRGLMEDLLTGRVRVSVGESDPGKQAEAEPPANISFKSPHPPAFDPVVNFRASAGADPAAQTDWVAQAREIAARQQVAAYSREALDRAVHDLAELSRTLDGILQVPDVLKAAGVRFVLLKHPKGSKTSGAAFWLDAEARPSTQPVVALSMRYPHIDVFWFNLFHELGHIWHGHAAVMGEELVTYSDPAPAEQEAHAYAREALIPDAVWQPYLRTGNHTMRGILAFARTVGRHHATVAGRLGNDLKDFARFNSREHRPSIPNDLFDRLLLRLGGSL